MKPDTHLKWLSTLAGFCLCVLASPAAFAVDNIIGDGSFEMNDGSWAFSGTAFNPRCSQFTCGPALATDGFVYLWLGGGALDNGNGGTATQTLNIPADGMELTFDWISGSNDPVNDCESPDDDRLEVLIDGNLVWRSPAPCIVQEATTATIDLDGLGYNDDGSHTIVFQAFNIDAMLGSGILTNFFIDNVIIDITPMEDDSDVDGVVDSVDNCTNVVNPLQEDTNGDGIGNACDPDVNNDCIVNFIDISQFTPRFNTGTGDVLYDANFDIDSSDSLNFVDYIQYTSNFQMPPGPSANECVPGLGN